MPELCELRRGEPNIKAVYLSTKESHGYRFAVRSEEIYKGIRTSRNCDIGNPCTLVLFQLLSSLFIIKDV